MGLPPIGTALRAGRQRSESSAGQRDAPSFFPEGLRRASAQMPNSGSAALRVFRGPGKVCARPLAGAGSPALLGLVAVWGRGSRLSRRPRFVLAWSPRIQALPQLFAVRGSRGKTSNKLRDNEVYGKRTICGFSPPLEGKRERVKRLSSSKRARRGEVSLLRVAASRKEKPQLRFACALSRARATGAR